MESAVKMELDVCDLCFRPPNGDSPDSILFYSPCGHAICDECQDYAVRKHRTEVGHCGKCGEGVDGYTRKR
jgi:hypothetical protein